MTNHNYDASAHCNAELLGPSLIEICKFPPFVVFLSLLNELIRKNHKISGICDRVTPIHTPDREYDFVVIGGGAGGATAASRLSENSDWKVLLLEAGPDEPAVGEVPIFADSLTGTSVDWNYTITNETYACLSTNGTCLLSAGKCLGGGTALNYMIYTRGNPTDYNNWAALGNEGWTWEEVKKFFLFAEDNGEIERVGRKYHSTGGLLSVERFPYLPPFGNSVLTASMEAGYGVTDDPNGAKVTGFTIAQSTSKKGVRRSSASAYLRPARNRTNLHVSLNSLGARVLIKNHRAVGVEFYDKDGKLRTVRTKREVIVSAGTTRSPQILMLSGIGPKEYLRSMSIPVVKDLPGVGENLHNHVGFALHFVINDTDAWDNNWATASEYLAYQTGPLSQPGLTPAMGLLSTNTSTPDFPDVQMYFTGFSHACAPGEINALRSRGRRQVGIQVVNMHPKSRGRVSLASQDPFEYPVSWFNYLSDSKDSEVLVKSIELALALIDTEAMRAWNLTLTTEPIEACSDYTFTSTEYWACAIHQDTAQQIHPAGSCKMGPASDPMAVVDPQLRVHGIKGLRVADASIMPVIISGNIGAPTMMIGERVADFIKKDLRRKNGNKEASSRDRCMETML